MNYIHGARYWVSSVAAQLVSCVESLVKDLSGLVLCLWLLEGCLDPIIVPGHLQDGWMDDGWMSVMEGKTGEGFPLGNQETGLGMFHFVFLTSRWRCHSG